MSFNSKEDDVESYGEISFKQNKFKKSAKSLLKGISFVLLAVISGGISGAVVTKYNNPTAALNNIYTRINNMTSTGQPTTHPRNTVNNVAETIGPAVVGITAKESENSISFSVGSGIIIKSDGYVVTNYHIIQKSNVIYVKLAGSSSVFKATVIGYNKRTDIAVIKINMSNLPVVTLGSEAYTKVGDVAITIGNPTGQDFVGSVTVGVISATDRKIHIVNLGTAESTACSVFQTDAIINNNNSGGPLCNEFGEVIGINSVNLAGNINGSDGMFYAVNVDEMKSVVDAILKDGYKTSFYFGIKGKAAEVKSDKNIEGIFVSAVVVGSGAYEANLHVTDIITQVDGEKVATWESFQKILEDHKLGDILNCLVWRNGQVINVNIKLSDNISD